ncbi:MAG: hypothetical protein IPP51_01595 [Bacteroidetes bacterium]|nr:hypothetical protein [Bacteroidota bacterium]
MSRKVVFRLSGLMILLSIFFISCEKTDPDGPSTADRDKFIGTWLGNSTGPGGTRTFNFTITISNSAADQVIFKNFDGTGTNASIFATVSGSSFSFVSTLVGSDRYEGTGSLSNGTMSFNFTVDDGQTIESRSGTAHQ